MMSRRVVLAQSKFLYIRVQPWHSVIIIIMILTGKLQVWVGIPPTVYSLAALGVIVMPFYLLVFTCMYVLNLEFGVFGTLILPSLLLYTE
jgi:hypothetical protein